MQTPKYIQGYWRGRHKAEAKPTDGVDPIQVTLLALMLLAVAILLWKLVIVALALSAAGYGLRQYLRTTKLKINYGG